MKKVLYAIMILAMVCSLSTPAFAAGGPYYWDTDGAVAGFGNVAGTWGTSTFWSTSAAGTNATSNPPTDTSDAVNFGTGALTIGATGSAVGVSGTVAAASMTFGSAQATAVNISGGTAINLGAAATITVNNTSDTIGSLISGAATSLTKAGTGTLILSGANTYSSATAIQNGTVSVSSIGNSGSAGNLGTNGTITLGLAASANTGTLKYTGTGETTNRAFDLAGTFGGGTIDQSGTGALKFTGTNTASGAANTLTLTGSSAGTGEIAGAIVNGTGATSVIKTGTGTWTLSGLNTYSGGTIFTTAGTLNINNASALGTGTFQLGGAGVTIDNTSGAAITNANNNPITMAGNIIFTGTNDLNAGTGPMDMNAAGGTCTVNGGTLTVGGVMSHDVGGGFTKAGTGTLVLNGHNTYTGVTTISAGTLRISDPTALGTGGLANVANNATLDIGSTALSIGGTYIQGALADATLKIAVNGTTSGSIATGGVSTTTAGDSLVLAVTNYVPNNQAYTIIDSGGVGTYAALTITDDSPRVSFTASTVGNDLVLTASSSGTGFGSLAANSNAAAAGNTLDNVTNPSADMTTVLNTFTGLSNPQITAALNTVTPIADAGVLNTSTSVLNNFLGVAMERTENVLKLAQNTSASAATGLSAGDEALLNGVWAKGYGSYLNQDLRNDVQGYNAWNAGTAIGIDRLFCENITLGISGGYAYGNINSDAENGNTYINSGQGTVYGGYQFSDVPVFIDAAGTFAWNWYNGRRDINIGGAILRRANAQYDGQQYGAYVGGGYRYDAGHNLILTPLASLNYIHLHLAGYTETEAGALNVTAQSQDYNFLQSGIGARAEYPVKIDYGTLTPEVHGKWLYDFIGDNVQMTSTFTGGGAAFNTNGASPAQSSFDVGGKLSLAMKNDVTITGQCDTELKQDFWGIYGSVAVRYNF